MFMTQGVLKTHGICLMMYFKNNWNAGPFFLLHGYNIIDNIIDIIYPLKRGYIISIIFLLIFKPV